MPGEAIASGEIRNMWEGHGNQMCIDSAAKKGDLNKPVGLYPCHNQASVCSLCPYHIIPTLGRKPILDDVKGGRDPER